MNTYARVFNALIIFIICGVLLAAYGVQIFEHERPCPLCLLQRICMISVSTACLMNLQFGIKPAHYGLALLSSLLGGSVALRQITLHVCPTFSKFGIPVLGLSLYTWSFLIFSCVVFSVALLLFLYRPEEEKERIEMNYFEKLAFILLLLVTSANVVTTFIQCGWGPCAD